MINNLFLQLEIFENILWGFVAVPFIILLGLFLSFQSRFVQIIRFPTIIKTFFGFMFVHDREKGSVHPLQAFFACIGGCVGIGNIVGITTAVQIGGPGALLWIWVTAIAGMMIKYGEVFLGIRYRVRNAEGNYNGGPEIYMVTVGKLNVEIDIYGISDHALVKTVTAKVLIPPSLSKNDEDMAAETASQTAHQIQQALKGVYISSIPPVFPPAANTTPAAAAAPAPPAVAPNGPEAMASISSSRPTPAAPRSPLTATTREHAQPDQNETRHALHQAHQNGFSTLGTIHRNRGRRIAHHRGGLGPSEAMSAASCAP